MKWVTINIKIFFFKKIIIESWLFNQKKLQNYLLICCQDKEGGMKDKPSKIRDCYHTCYALSGISIAQHNKKKEPTIVGNQKNLLVKIF